MSLVGDLAARAHSVAAGPIPAAVRTATRAHLTDAAGALVAGHTSLHGPVERLADSLGLGNARRTAFVGGVYAHCWETGDIHRGAVLCPGCIVLPATLAVLPACPSVSTEQFERAYLAGYEVALAAAIAVRGERLIQRGWWPTALVAPLGGAAAVSVLLGRSPESTASAIALAAQHAGGAIAGTTERADGRHLLSGFAAERAVTAVLAADAGWTGPLDILDDPRSPIQRVDPDAGLVSGYLLPETSLKPHAGAKHLQSAIDAVLALRAQVTGEIERLTCYLPAQLAKVIDRPPPFGSVLNALGSAQFVLAVSALRGRCTPADFDGATLRDEELLALAGKIRIETADDLSAAYPAKWGARVEITTSSGTVHAERLDARGDPGCPLSEAEITGKFVTLAGGSFGDEKAHAVAESLLHPDPAGLPSTLSEYLLPLLGSPSREPRADTLVPSLEGAVPAGARTGGSS
ncbi:MmgE/PrpD family protein [Amycolatopsis sp.]|jgi:2-methylcitrate dehydratase PrpD|uniref:MmgE/PrpD family protein n=1 Tax=Amycolatopsis sp. TaxID=37632 RepID=UPI002DF7947F|nr:MmgE/PrpD family protein [Amycolatopsis sp.]